MRSSVITFSAAGCANVARTVNQAGKPEFVTCAESLNVAKVGQTVTLSGTSNSSKLSFKVETPPSRVGKPDTRLLTTLPESYTAAGMSTELGAAISGDPGANAQYGWSLTLTYIKNEASYERTCQIIVTDEAGHTALCNVTQAAGDAYLRVAEGNIILDYQGTPVSVAVESNTNWAVS